MRPWALGILLVACGPQSVSNDAGTDGSTTDAGTDAVACAQPNTMCGAACVDTTKDTGNCGVCGNACTGGAACCGGACSTTCAMTVASVAPSGGPMSGGTWITIKGDGFASGARVTLGSSRAPARVLDAQTIVALSPPGLAANVAVTVTQGSSTSSRAAAFRYAAYGFKGPWSKIDMSSARGNWPGISVLQDGRVLITGGVLNSSASSVLATADVYDPSVTQSSKTAGDMSATRWTQAQVTLFDGTALALGTWMGGYSPPSGPFADRFDPKSGTFTATKGKPTTEHRWPHAAMLPDGRVLVASYLTAAPDIYDPQTDAFTPLASAPDTTAYRPARLLDGRVLFVKGGKAPVEIWDPDANSWTQSGAGPSASDGDVYTLPDGRVLVVAGTITTSTSTTPTDVLELFDPKNASAGFAPASYHLTEPRQRSMTTAMLGDGTVLVIGGEIGDNVLNPACMVNTFVLTSGVERIDPVAKSVSTFDALPEKNFVMSAATMHDGSVVSAGGAPCGGADAYPYFYFLQGVTPN